MPAAPLEGIRVVEITAAQFGPQVGMFLADWGADVIKIEAPSLAAAPRTPLTTPAQAYFHSANRNKRSIGLDLATPAGKEVCRRLITRSDVLVQNLRAGVMERLGFGYETVATLNPRLVYAACSGVGPDGPYAHLRSLDGVAQALGGLVAATGEPGNPVPAGATVVDLASSFLAASGILLALRARERDGLGQRVDASLLNTAVALQAWESAIYLNLGLEGASSGSGHHFSNRYFSSIYNVFAAADGHLMIATVQNDRWEQFCSIIGQPELAGEAQFATAEARMADHDALRQRIAEAVETIPRAQLLKHLQAADIACAPVQGQAEVFQDPQVLHNEMVVEVPSGAEGQPIRSLAPAVRLSRTPAEIRMGAPELGEHTSAVLTDLGYTDEESSGLHDAGVVR